MDPRIRIHTKMSWIRNTGLKGGGTDKESPPPHPVLSRHLVAGFAAVLQIRIRIRINRIHMFLGLPDPDPDPLVRGMDPDPDFIFEK
jgi:hypothetical protein